MDRTCRINRAFLDILAADERLARQEERVAALDEARMHTAATCARETLMMMAERFLDLCRKHESRMDTARRIEGARRARTVLVTNAT